MVRALPLLRTWTPGDLATAAFMNAINYAITFGCLQPPQCEVFQTVTQNFTTSSSGAVLFDSETVDSDGFHSTSSNTDRLIAPWPGWYELKGAVSYASNATGRRGAQWGYLGTAFAESMLGAGTATGSLVVLAPTVRLFMNALDYVQLFGFQDSGGTLGTIVGGVADSRAMITFVSQ